MLYYFMSLIQVVQTFHAVAATQRWTDFSLKNGQTTVTSKVAGCFCIYIQTVLLNLRDYVFFFAITLIHIAHCYDRVRSIL